MQSSLAQMGIQDQTVQSSAKLVHLLDMDGYKLLLLEDQSGRRIVSCRQTDVVLKPDQVYSFKATTRSVRNDKGYIRHYTSAEQVSPIKIDPKVYEFKGLPPSDVPKRNLVCPELLLKVTKVEEKPNSNGTIRRELALKSSDNHTYYLTIFESSKQFERLDQEFQGQVLLENYSCTTEPDKRYSRLTSNPFSNVSL